MITIVFSSFWPQSARSGVRASIAGALRAIGEVVRQPRHAEEARMRTVQTLVRADHLRTLSLFELRMLPSHVRESLHIPSVASVERLAGAAFVVSTDAISRYAEPGSTARVAEWAESAADSVLSGRPLPPSPVPPSPVPPSLAPTASSPVTAMEADAHWSQHAIEQLESEVQHVASAVR